MTKLKLEVGRYYRTRYGRKVGPATYDAGDLCGYPWCLDGYWYSNAGRFISNVSREYDLIAEWTDTPTGPVITETVKRIVPGVYGKVEVGGRCEVDNDVLVTIDEWMSRDDLTEAIATLTAIRDAL